MSRLRSKKTVISVISATLFLGLILTLGFSRYEYEPHFEERLQSKSAPRFTSLSGIAGLRNRDGQGVYNIPVENRNGGWDITEHESPEFDAELKEPEKRDIFSPFASGDADGNSLAQDSTAAAADYADFYRAYSAYQLPQEASNLSPRAAAARGMSSWTDGAYGLPRHGLPYSRPLSFHRQQQPAVRVVAQGKGSANYFRLSGPGVINVTIGDPSPPEGGQEEGRAGEGQASFDPWRRKTLVPATDKDWGSASGRLKLQPCRPRGALPWLAVTADTPMCVDPGAAAVGRRFWQDALDDADY